MFRAINYLLYEKNKKELDVEILDSFNPFFVTKAFSFYAGGEYCDYINDTLNKYSGIFKTKEEQFKFFDNIIPKVKRRGNEYIKSLKKEKEQDLKIHIPEFLSKRELLIYNSYDKGTD